MIRATRGCCPIIYLEVKVYTCYQICIPDPTLRVLAKGSTKSSQSDSKLINGGAVFETLRRHIRKELPTRLIK